LVLALLFLLADSVAARAYRRGAVARGCQRPNRDLGRGRSRPVTPRATRACPQQCRTPSPFLQVFRPDLEWSGKWPGFRESRSGRDQRHIRDFAQNPDRARDSPGPTIWHIPTWQGSEESTPMPAGVSGILRSSSTRMGSGLTGRLRRCRRALHYRRALHGPQSPRPHGGRLPVANLNMPASLSETRRLRAGPCARPSESESNGCLLGY
jgi:hypothetical protein